MHRLLAETEYYRVEHEVEVVTLRDIRKGRYVVIGDFYGDPEAAVIDRQERWVVTAGCGLILYYLREPFAPYTYGQYSNQWTELFREPNNVWWIESLEQISENELKFVVDSVSAQAGRYLLDTQSLTVRFY